MFTIDPNWIAYIGTQGIDSVRMELGNSLGQCRNTNGFLEIRIFPYGGRWRHRFRNDPVTLRTMDPAEIIGK